VDGVAGGGRNRCAGLGLACEEAEEDERVMVRVMEGSTRAHGVGEVLRHGAQAAAGGAMLRRAIVVEPVREREGKQVGDDAHLHAKLRLWLYIEEECW
jgi:hypothetical protein